MKKKLRWSILGLLITPLFVTPVHAYDTDMLREAINIEFSEYEAIGDGYVLLENYEAGFSEASFKYGVYDYINQKWIMEYQPFEGYVGDAEYVGEGMFAYLSGDTTYLVNAELQLVMPVDLKIIPRQLHYRNGHAVVVSRKFDEQDSYDVYVLSKNGTYFCAGLSDWVDTYSLEHCVVDEKYAVYSYDDSGFIIYNHQDDSIIDIYAPEYAEKMDDDWNELLHAAICGDNYLALLNMTGEDNRNYYAVLDFEGNVVVSATQCDYATFSERGNLVVINDDVAEEVILADVILEKAQPLENLALVFKKDDSRCKEPMGMDKKGNVYKNVMEYENISYLDDAPAYDQADKWYLGGNYSEFKGTWYYPDGTTDDGFTKVRLVGDGNPIYESEVLDAQNPHVDFDVDVTGIRELQLEYDGEQSVMCDLMLGLANARLLPMGVQEENDSELVNKQDMEPEEIVSGNSDNYKMLYDLHAYKGDLEKSLIMTDNMGNEYYNAIGVYGKCMAIYDIGKQYSTLTGTVAVTEAETNQYDEGKTGYIRVYGDDVLLWEDATINDMTKPYDFYVDISGVTDLKVEADGYSTSMAWDYLAVILENVRLQ